MRVPSCVIVGSGRIAGGFLVPVLRDAGWDVTLVCRDQAICDAIMGGGGVGVQLGDQPARWYGGLRALTWEDPHLPAVARRSDLMATAVGPGALDTVGRELAPLVRHRLDTTLQPLNIVTFENHRRAPELLARGLIDRDLSLAGEIGRTLGIGGAAVWRAVSTRAQTETGVWFRGDDVDECAIDRRSLIPAGAPFSPSVPSWTLVDTFEAHIVEKLWVFNAGHAAAAYLGWHAGCATLDQALAQPQIRTLVRQVIDDAQRGFASYLATTPGVPALPRRDPEAVLRRYANPSLADTVIRVGREPRRKLQPGDRLLGPVVAAMAAGHQPRALATVIAAALAYAPPSDRQACDLQFELGLLGPEEVLAMVCGVDATDEVTRLIADRYRAVVATGVGATR